ncbi:MAG: hypothetical protein ACHQ1G_01360 [Planctomycetota bacterium]
MSVRGRTRWFAVVVLGMVAALYVANLPFYAGASFEGWSWRMEHGRMTIQRNPDLQPKPFWVDLNSEGLRWSAQWSAGADRWTLAIPLWIPLGLCLAWCAVSWRRRVTRSEVS